MSKKLLFFVFWFTFNGPNDKPDAKKKIIKIRADNLKDAIYEFYQAAPSATDVTVLTPDSSLFQPCNQHGIIKSL